MFPLLISCVAGFVISLACNQFTPRISNLSINDANKPNANAYWLIRNLLRMVNSYANAELFYNQYLRIAPSFSRSFAEFGDPAYVLCGVIVLK